MKKIGFFLGSMLLWSVVTSQPLLSHQKSLGEFLKELEQRYNVTIVFQERLVEGKLVDHAFWRLRNDIETTLHLALGPHNLVFIRQGDNHYEISPFQYHRRPPYEGAGHLSQLATLFPSLDEWELRRTHLKAHLQESLNLAPWPEKSPLRPMHSPLRLHDGYTTENVALETLPGLFLSGTLYRPVLGEGPFAAILLAQGHFMHQRFGEEPQIMAATLARMGAVVFSYDMFAVNESQLQFSIDDHRTPTAMIVQTWNSIRVIDFLESLPYVDAARIGMTGASGGGTQTFLAAALDDRIAASAPVVMVSSWFYGGCACESSMPIHDCSEFRSNNVEIAAMAAPRPLLLVSVGGDWTATTPDVEFPFIENVFGFYGQTGRVNNVHLSAEGHDLGRSKREAVYHFFAGNLGLSPESVTNASGEIDESLSVVEPHPSMYTFGENGEELPERAIIGLENLIKIYPFLRGQ